MSLLVAVTDYLRLKDLATVLPRRLATAYGSGERYTVQQVRRAVSDLRLRRGVTPYALAAACSLEEVQRAGVGISAERYRQLRAEIANFLSLPADFTMRHLRRAAPANGGAPALGLVALMSLQFLAGGEGGDGGAGADGGGGGDGGDG